MKICSSAVTDDDATGSNTRHGDVLIACAWRPRPCVVELSWSRQLGRPEVNYSQRGDLLSHRNDVFSDAKARRPSEEAEPLSLQRPKTFPNAHEVMIRTGRRCVSRTLGLAAVVWNSSLTGLFPIACASPRLTHVAAWLLSAARPRLTRLSGSP